MIEAMKQALEALEDIFGKNKVDVGAINSLRQAIAEAEKQEPVAVWELQECGWETICDPDWLMTLPIGTLLYTHPPKREWVGLTDEEKLHIEIMGGKSDVMLAEMVEDKLKEKNK